MFRTSILFVVVLTAFGDCQIFAQGGRRYVPPVVIRGPGGAPPRAPGVPTNARPRKPVNDNGHRPAGRDGAGTGRTGTQAASKSIPAARSTEVMRARATVRQTILRWRNALRLRLLRARQVLARTAAEKEKQKQERELENDAVAMALGIGSVDGASGELPPSPPPGPSSGSGPEKPRLTESFNSARGRTSPRVSSQALTTRIPPAKVRKLSERGWTTSSIDALIAKPFAVRRSLDRTRGARPSTVYIRPDGHYIVREDITGMLVQMSDTRLRIGRDTAIEWVPDSDIEDYPWSQISIKP